MRWIGTNGLIRFLVTRFRLILGFFISLIVLNQLFLIPKRYNWNNHLSCLTSSLQNKNISKISQNFLDNLPKINWEQGRFDESRMYRIYEWAWTGSLWKELASNVCLATQASIDRIHHIAETSNNWLGKISFAILIKSISDFHILVEFVEYMRHCDENFLKTVSIHVTVPVNSFNLSQLTISYNHANKDSLECGKPLDFLTKKFRKYHKNKLPFTLYPQNLQRNIARKTCGTKWVYLTDVDIITSFNSSQRLDEFLRSPDSEKCKRCAFVIPVFELERSVAYPKSKSGLISYAKTGLGRQFHLKVYRNGHWATNYSLWMETYIEEGSVRISHSVDLKSASDYYEPFYVSHDSIPAHDQRFIGYGFTRSSQVLEARMVGWDFKVLSPLYGIHWGLHTLSSIRNPTQETQQFLNGPNNGSNGGGGFIVSRKLQTATNYVKNYKSFLREIRQKYGIHNWKTIDENQLKS